MASVTYCSAAKLEPNVHSEEMRIMQELLFDFNYDVEPNFHENMDQDCYIDPFFNPDEFILPVEMSNNSYFMPEYSAFEKQQEVFQDNRLPDDIMTPSIHNSCFVPEYPVYESTSIRQKVFHDNFLPNNIIAPSTHTPSFMPGHSIFASTPKRQEDNFLPPSSLLNEGFVPNPPIFQDFASYSLPEIPMPVFSSGCSNNAGVVMKRSGGNSNNNEKKMSAQSIAARQRRKKITDKTHELGKLIPGGHRMNTAEMLQATFKYIKFLQAQAGLLEFMGSYEKDENSFHTSDLQKDENSFHTSDLQKLVGSTLIREKLYSSEKCLVPKVFLEALENNQEFQNSQVLEEVKSLTR